MSQERSLINDRFRIESKIAQGGMATVYKGTDLTLGRTVAIKVLSDDLAQDPTFVARFRLEAKAAASLSHPNIVAVYDTGSDDDLHYIVMEYLEGRSLDVILRQSSAFTPVEVAAVGAQVAKALGAAHEKGIIHRDVKPGNIMIDKSGKAKVMDFGIAKAASAEGLTQVGSILGTVAYLSPEQARGEKLDGRSDIYALGCLLYQMLTGKPPLEGDTYPEMVNMLNTRMPVPPSELNPDVPSDLQAVVLRSLQKSPEDRFQTGAEMAAALRGFLRSETGGTPPVPPPTAEAVSAATVVQKAGGREGSTRVIPRPAPPEPSRDNSTRTIIGIGAIVALVAIAFVLFNSLRNPPVEIAPTPELELVTEDPQPPAAEPSEPGEREPTPTPSPTPPPSPEPEPEPEPEPTATQGEPVEPPPPPAPPPLLPSLLDELTP